MSFVVASFNANSLRARLPIVKDWLQAQGPDLLCIQETKVQDKDFPAEELRETGYLSHFKGQKSYNGVAVLCREEPQEVRLGFEDGEPEEDARFMAVKSRGIWVINTYVPQGKEVDNPAFQYKLEFYARVGRYLAANFQPSDKVLWTGDLNVAPADLDVHDPKRLAGHVCFHPDEHKALARVMEWGLGDLFRKHHPEDKQFTFWDYRVPNGFKRNLGWRIDHMMASEALAEASLDCWVDAEPRALPKPSDHTFLLASFDL